ncbi:mechanosensitive ion channel [Thalassotalea sp. HSM 43]|nr:mechanosensitive ion channel [Thalassotalea sp. HSM 43]
MFASLLRVLLGIVVLLLINSSVVKAEEDLTLKEVKERQEQANQAIRNAQSLPIDSPLRGKTPLSSLLSIGEALQSGDYKNAAKYFDFRYLDKQLSDERKAELIHRLTIVWSQHHSLDISLLSDDEQGHVEDGLPANRDLLGVIKTSKDDVPIYLQRITTDDGRLMWKISGSSVANIPALWQEFGYHPWAESISHILPEFQLLDMENWQFVSFVIILVFSWYFTALIRQILLKLVEFSDTYRRTMRRFISIPLRLFLFFILIQWLSGHLGLSINARVWIDTGTLNYLAAIFLSMGIIEFCFALYSSRAENDDQNAIAIIKPMVTTLKIFVVMVYLLNWFDDAGFNITTIITGLGIGSLAVALAAQKSLENIFGAFTLYIARPVKPGDMCKFGNTQGRVEEIGLRSTKMRKLNRAVVHVPNSVIASMDLENIGEIDHRYYNKRFRVRLNTPRQTLQTLVEQMRDLVVNHPNVVDLETYVRFEHVDVDAFVIVVNAYVTTSNRVVYKQYEEDLNFKILELIDRLGVELALPEQHLALKNIK